MFDVADCLEILNAISLYSHYWDENRFDDWLDLYTTDAILELPLPAGNFRVVVSWAPPGVA